MSNFPPYRLVARQTARESPDRPLQSAAAALGNLQYSNERGYFAVDKLWYFEVEHCGNNARETGSGVD